MGEEFMGLVRKLYVVVVGCGGVGSWCVLMLLRRLVFCVLVIILCLVLKIVNNICSGVGCIFFIDVCKEFFNFCVKSLFI